MIAYFVPYILLSLFHFPFLLGEKLDFSVQAEAAILINAETGVILYEKNAHSLHYPASVTKIATALYALQKVGDKLDEMIAADQDCIGTVTEEVMKRSNYTLPPYYLIPDGSHIGIKRGEVLSLRDLLYGMMLASGDDAANVIAKYVGGTIPKFMEDLNAYIKNVGCHSSIFYNPHGLHHPKQQTTAYDLAILTKEALKNPTFRKIVSTVRYTRPKTNKQEPTPLVQTNRLMRHGPSYYSKAIGVKTGYYSLAANTLVAAAKDQDRTLIAVLLKVQNRKDMFLDAVKMFEAAFGQMKIKYILLQKGIQKFALEIAGSKKKVAAYTDEDAVLECYPAEKPEIKCLLNWDKKLKLPIFKDQRVGELVFTAEYGHLFKKIPLYAQEDVSMKFLYRMESFFVKNGQALLKSLVAISAFAFLGTCFFLLWRRA